MFRARALTIMGVVIGLLTIDAIAGGFLCGDVNVLEELSKNGEIIQSITNRYPKEKLPLTKCGLPGDLSPAICTECTDEVSESQTTSLIESSR